MRRRIVLVVIHFVASLLTTVVLMVTIFYLAIIPAFFALAFFVMLLLANRAELSTRDPEAPAPRDWAEGPLPGEPVAKVDSEVEEKAEVTKAVQHRLNRIGIEVVVAAIVIAVVMGGLTFGWSKVAFGALFLFGYVILVTTPVWLGWMEEEVEEEVSSHEQEVH